MRTIDRRGMAKLDHRGMIDTIYTGDYQTLLHTKYRSSGHCGFREEEILIFRIVSLWKLSTPGTWPNDPRSMADTVYVEDH